MLQAFCYAIFGFISFINLVPERAEEVQVAYFAGFGAMVAAADLYAYFLVADFYEVVDNFTEKGFTQYHAAHAVDVVFVGKTDFGRAAGQVEHSFA